MLFRSSRTGRDLNFASVEERFEENDIDASAGQRLHLLRKSRLDFARRSGSQFAGGLLAGADISADQSLRSRGFARQPNGSAIDRIDPITQSEAPQLDPVGAESVGQNQLGARLDVGAVDIADQRRIRQHQFFITGIDEDAFFIDGRPHGAVEDQRLTPQVFKIFVHKGGIEAENRGKNKRRN